MFRRDFSYSLLCALVAIGVSHIVAAERPNFILIFTDDQGYNDLGCFGSPNIETPNIDRMAREGMRFTSFYSGASVCTPSRAALLTGCYPERVGNLPVLFPHSDRGLHHDETTLAEMLKDVGYATCCVGKWHLGHHSQFLPTEHGFDQYFGVPYSNDMGVDATMTLSPNIIFREGKTEADFRSTSEKLPPLLRDKEVIEWPADQTQLTQRYTREVIEFIRTNRSQPFFVYLPHTMPHIPLYASDEFRGRSEAGLYGDTLQEIDWSVGQILQTLEDLGIDQNTMIIYTSDNGPWDLKGNDTDKVKGNMNRRIGGSADPLRGFKFSHWEGGMRVPCVMHWPGKIPAGQSCDEVTASIDLLPTLAALSGAQLPERKIDGLSIVPLLSGDAQAGSPHEAYFYRTVGVRIGKWKFINGELFDLEADISEAHNLAKEFPEVAERLRDRLAQHVEQMSQEGRPPAYHERPPYPFASNPQWTVLKGRWTEAADNLLKQHSDWTTAQLQSRELPSNLRWVEVEAKRHGSDGGYALGIENSDDQILLRVHANGGCTLRRRSTKVQSQPADFQLGKWHKLRIEVNGNLVFASVDGEQIGTIDIESPFSARQLSLRTFSSAADFRKLEVHGENGQTLLRDFGEK